MLRTLESVLHTPISCKDVSFQMLTSGEREREKAEKTHMHEYTHTHTHTHSKRNLP